MKLWWSSLHAGDLIRQHGRRFGLENLALRNHSPLLTTPTPSAFFAVRRGSKLAHMSSFRDTYLRSSVADDLFPPSYCSLCPRTS